LSQANLNSFPAAFEKWYSDHFPFRNTLINGRMTVDIYGFRQSPIPSFVIMGQDNWLYNTGNEIEVFRGTNLFSAEDLRAMQRELMRE